MGVERTIDVTAGQRKTILALLERHLPGTEAWVYGSRAKWTSRPQSDLDLVVFATPQQRRRVGNLREAFEESNLPFRVDLFVWDEVPETFREQIEAERVVLVEGRSQDAASQQLFDTLPDGWECTTLGIACATAGGNIQTGPFRSQLHASDYVSSGIPSIMPQNIGDNRILADGIARITPDDASRLSRYLVREGDIVYSRRGDVKRRALVRSAEDGWLCGTGCLRIRLGKNGVDSRYASYYLGHPDVQDWIVRHAHGATMPNLNTSILSECPFVIPSKPEQRAIAQILDTLDDRIELNRRMSETAEAMARTLFKSWFVDFDPVRAKASGRDTGLPQPLADLFPAHLADSDLGEIPEGWEVGTVADLSALNPETWTKGERPAEIRYIDLSNTKRGRTEAITPYAAAEAPSRAQRVLRPGDTIVGTVRPGNGSYALVSELGLTGSTGFAVLRPKAAEFTEFVYLATTSADSIDALAHLADGAAYPAVRPDVVAATPIVRPDRKVMTRFSSSASALLGRIARSEKESRTLASLRDLLLPKLISGEIGLRQAENAVEAVA